MEMFSDLYQPGIFNLGDTPAVTPGKHVTKCHFRKRHSFLDFVVMNRQANDPRRNLKRQRDDVIQLTSPRARAGDKTYASLNFDSFSNCVFGFNFEQILLGQDVDLGDLCGIFECSTKIDKCVLENKRD